MTTIISIERTRIDRQVVNYLCDNCQCECRSGKGAYDRKINHFCSGKCRGEYMKVRAIVTPVESKWLFLRKPWTNILTN